jgi:hypothetical protein
MLRKWAVAAVALVSTLVLASDVSAQRVLLLHSEDPSSGRAQDVASKLWSTGAFTQIDLLQVGGPGSPATPSPATLAPYQAVMVWSSLPFADPVQLGTVLAGYVNQGGGVVQSTFAFCTEPLFGPPPRGCIAIPSGPPPVAGLGLDGAWQTGGYLAFMESSQYFRRTGGPTYQLAPNPAFAGHPILDGVSSVDGGTSAWHNATTPTAGTSLIAAWNPTGRPFVGARNGPIAGRIVGLNMYPPSSDAVAGGWNPATDGARLMANALLFVMAPPAFSHGPVATPPGACVCTPLLMNTNAEGMQHWWVRAQGGPLTITAVAHAVNSSDPETVQADVYDPDGNLVMTLTTGYEAGQAPGFESSATGVLATAAAGEIYRVTVTTPDTPDAQSHYRLEFEGADSAATSSPTSPSFTSQSPVTWFLNVGAGESLDVRVTVDGTPASSTTINYTLFDPQGTPTSGSVTASTGSDATISVPAAADGMWALRVDTATDYYRLDKTTGADRGVYLTWESVDRVPPVITVPDDIVVSAAGPDGTFVTFEVTAHDPGGSGVPVTCEPPSGSLFPIGETTVACTATDPSGNVGTATFTVTVEDVTTPGQMHGIGFIREGGTRYEFAFIVRETASVGERGAFALRVVDRGARWWLRRNDWFVARTVDFAAFSDDPAYTPGRPPRPNVDTVFFSGSGRWNGEDGYSYEVFAEDRGEPGRHRESVWITIRKPNGTVVAHVEGEIDGGNVQSSRVRH